MGVKENLMAAFAGESQANRKYLAFAGQAEKEGYPMLARLFRAIAEAETIHALKLLDIAGGVGSTRDNLGAALEGETYEFTKMYPDFIADAEQEGDKAAQRIFHLANEAEKIHAERFKKAIGSLKGNQDFPAEAFFLCPVCGYLAENQAPERCPICGAPGRSFKPY
ncbi:MAG: rubrerythrin family protein [Syntrophomonadaceae bacterium]|nr:rubrerythrin family protein [Syntrophomonadaceae bacterium]